MSLPPEGRAVVAGIDIGEGRVISPDPSFARTPGSGPVLWLSNVPVKDGAKRWNELRRAFPRTGLWPLLLAGSEGDINSPWAAGELDPMPVDESDAVTVFSRRWREEMPDELETEPTLQDAIGPFGRQFPGLAPVPVKQVSEDVYEAVAKKIAPGRYLGLVATPRPADALAAVASALGLLVGLIGSSTRRTNR